jgi:glycosyltransferase involved in cell wall biosynthesis
MNDKKYSIALIAPPWWLIPSKDIVTATENLIEDYAYNLRKRGYSNIIFSRERDFTDRCEVLDINKYKSEFKYTKVNKLERKFFGKSNRLFFYSFYILKVAWQIRKLNIKKIIVFQTFPFCYWIKLINPQSKLLFHIGSHELSKKTNYYNYGFVRDSLFFLVSPQIDKIITVSKHIERGIAERFPWVSGKIKTVYAGIDTEMFLPKKRDNRGEVVITYAGRVVPEKGLDILLEAFKNLKEKYDNIFLNVIGGEIGPNVPKGYKESLRGRGIKIFGLVPRTDLVEILAKSSVFVYPVIMEDAFGLAPVEAMAMGIPTIVSDSNSGYREIINTENAFYFKKGDEKDLEEVLEKIILDIDFAQEVGMRGRETIEKELTWEKCISQTTKCFS